MGCITISTEVQELGIQEMMLKQPLILTCGDGLWYLLNKNNPGYQCRTYWDLYLPTIMEHLATPVSTISSTTARGQFHSLTKM